MLRRIHLPILPTGDLVYTGGYRPIVLYGKHLAPNAPPTLGPRKRGLFRDFFEPELEVGDFRPFEPGSLEKHGGSAL